MNAQQEVVAYWKFVESRGLKPSIRKAIAHCREYDIPISDQNARKWLLTFNAQSPHPMCRKQRKDSTKNAQDVQQESPPPRLRAHNKVPLVSQKNTSYSAASQPPLFSSPSGDGEGSRPRAKAKSDPSPKPKAQYEPPPEDLAAYAIMDKAWPVVKAHVTLGYGVTAWKQRNKTSALEMHKAGISPDDVADMLVVAYTYPDSKPYYDKVSQLAKLSEWWPRLLEIAERGPYCNSSNPDEPDVYEHAGRSDLESHLSPEDIAEITADVRARRAQEAAEMVRR